jgi:EVE domain
MVSTRSRGSEGGGGGAGGSNASSLAAAVTKKAAKRAKPTAKAEPKAALEERAAGEVRYWLLKSEPESRVEKDVEMKFGIDDLARRKDQTEPWDGVRNHEAKNAMLAMQVGDLGFFYRKTSERRPFFYTSWDKKTLCVFR